MEIVVYSKVLRGAG